MRREPATAIGRRAGGRGLIRADSVGRNDAVRDASCASDECPTRRVVSTRSTQKTRTQKTKQTNKVRNAPRLDLLHPPTERKRRKEMEREAKSLVVNYLVIILLLAVLWLVYTGVNPLSLALKPKF